MPSPTPDQLASHQYVLCDIDGVIADCTHRLHHILTPGLPKNWDAFDIGIPDDTPISPTITILSGLYNMGYDIILLTGRGERVRTATEQWLAKYNVDYDELIMRSRGDRRPAWVVKSRMLEKRGLHCNNVVCAFEDEPKTVDFFRGMGIFTYNPAEWADHYIEVSKGGPSA